MLCEVLCKGRKLSVDELRPFTGDVGLTDYLTLNELTNRFAGQNRKEFIRATNTKIVYISTCITQGRMFNIFDMYSHGYDSFIEMKRQDPSGNQEPVSFWSTSYNMLFAVMIHLAVIMVREHRNILMTEV